MKHGFCNKQDEFHCISNDTLNKRSFLRSGLNDDDKHSPFWYGINDDAREKGYKWWRKGWCKETTKRRQYIRPCFVI